MFHFAIPRPRSGRALLRADAEALTASSRSPVEKVVKLLRDMQATLIAEGKEDEKLYEKLSCWCETGNKEKNANVDAAEAEVKLLESDIEARGEAAKQLALDVKAGYEDQAKLKESLANADGQRKEQSLRNAACRVGCRRRYCTVLSYFTQMKANQHSRLEGTTRTART